MNFCLVLFFDGTNRRWQPVHSPRKHIDWATFSFHHGGSILFPNIPFSEIRDSIQGSYLELLQYSALFTFLYTSGVLGWEPTYPLLKALLSRRFSFSPGGICDRPLQKYVEQPAFSGEPSPLSSSKSSSMSPAVPMITTHSCCRFFRLLAVFLAGEKIRPLDEKKVLGEFEHILSRLPFFRWYDYQPPCSPIIRHRVNRGICWQAVVVVVVVVVVVQYIFGCPPSQLFVTTRTIDNPQGMFRGETFYLQLTIFGRGDNSKYIPGIFPPKKTQPTP